MKKSSHLILLVPFGTLHEVSSRELRRTFDPQSADFYFGRGNLLKKLSFSGSVTTVPFSEFSLPFSSGIFSSKRVCRSPSSGASRFVSF